MFDENKERIVEAGALPHYVKLLSPGRDESVQFAAVHGLSLLGHKCKDRLVKQLGCLEGYNLYSYYQMMMLPMISR